MPFPLYFCLFFYFGGTFSPLESPVHRCHLWRQLTEVIPTKGGTWKKWCSQTHTKEATRSQMKPSGWAKAFLTFKRTTCYMPNQDCRTIAFQLCSTADLSVQSVLWDHSWFSDLTVLTWKAIQYLSPYLLSVINCLPSYRSESQSKCTSHKPTISFQMLPTMIPAAHPLLPKRHCQWGRKT